MKQFCMAVVLLLLAGWVSLNAQAGGRKSDTLFQVSTLGALMAGDYDGKTSFREVKRHGDFGLGTFAALDGEMVAVDGVFYQVRDDGIATPVSNDQRTPFCRRHFLQGRRRLSHSRRN